MKSLLISAALVAAASASFVEIDTAIVVPNDWLLTSLEVDKSMLVDINVALTRPNMDKLESMVEERSDPRSPLYTHWFTSEELREMVAPPKANVAAVTAWLEAAGATNLRFSGVADDVITATLTYGAAEGLTGLPTAMYRKKGTNKVAPKAIGNARVPAGIAAAIDTITGLGAFPIEKSVLRSPGAPAEVQVVPQVLIERYNITTTEKVPTNNIKAVAEFGGQYVKQSDICQFYAQYKLNGSCTIHKFFGHDKNSAGVEATLDCEYIDAVSDDVPLDYYMFPGMDFCTDMTSWTSTILAAKDPGFVHSVSYGSQSYNPICPLSVRNRIDQDFMTMSGRGLSVVIASGDSGSGYYSRSGFNGGKLCPSWPAESPWCTSVGATYFYEGNKNVEMAVTGFGSGGGFSWTEKAQPSWQAAAVGKYFAGLPSSDLPPKGSYPDPKASRATPDVSALGWAYTLVYNGQLFPGIGGTSASTPVFAGMLARLNDLRIGAGKKPLGCVNAMLYMNEAAFYDVTIGSDKIGQNTVGWDCRPGWDPVTGLGTPNYRQLSKLVLELQ